MVRGAELVYARESPLKDLSELYIFNRQGGLYISFQTQLACLSNVKFSIRDSNLRTIGTAHIYISTFDIPPDIHNTKFHGSMISILHKPHFDINRDTYS